jgi:hypothetical protein
MYLILFLFLNLALAISPRCVQTKPLGQYCILNEQCYSNFCHQSRCTETPKEKEQCGPSYECATGLGCSEMVGGKCIPIPSEGQKCLWTNSGPHLCKEGLLCYNGICKVPMGPNSFCSDLTNQCRSDLGCSFERNGDSLCVTLKKLNESCTGGECESNLFCDQSTLKCTNRRSQGLRCSGNDCEQNFECVPNPYFILNIFKPYTCQKVCNGGCIPGFFCEK